MFLRCKFIHDKNNQREPLREEDKARLTEEVIEKMAKESLRTICIAYRDLGDVEQNWNDEESIIKDLTCIAIVGIEDPVRKEVKFLD